MAYFLQNRHIMMKTDSGNRNLDNLSWDYIGELCNRDEAGEIDINDYFKVGDSITIHVNEITGKPDGVSWPQDTYPEKDYLYRIIGIHQDTMTNGKRAALTIGPDYYSIYPQYFDDTESHTELYQNTQYSTSSIKNFIDNYFEKALPSDLQKYIKTVKKGSIQGIDSTTASGATVSDASNYYGQKYFWFEKVSSSERCFVPSIDEYLGTDFNNKQISPLSASDLSTGVGQYQYYIKHSDQIPDGRITRTAVLHNLRSGLTNHFGAIYITPSLFSSDNKIYAYTAQVNYYHATCNIMFCL